MLKNKIFDKNLFKLIISILITLLILSYSLYLFRVQLYEYNYIKEPTSENLIKLSNVLVETEDYDRMIKYLPIALELDNFLEISKDKELYLYRFRNETEAARHTYNTLISEYTLSLIHKDDYLLFQKEFPGLFDKIVMNYGIANFIESLKKDNKISYKGYENIIFAIEENTPKIEDVNIYDKEMILKIGYSYSIRITIYDLMSETLKGDTLASEYIHFLNSIKEVDK